MDDEERLLSCQQEIRRLRRIVLLMEEDARRFEEKLKEELELESDRQPGLIWAMELWQKIQNGEQ